MGSVEWNKKEELVAEQALKHLKVSGVLASSPGLRGEGKGRPGTHCMRMRHYSPDFGESGYVWILSVYLHRKLHVFKVMMSVSHIDATRTQPACPHGKRWVWLAILCPSLRRR